MTLSSVDSLTKNPIFQQLAVSLTTNVPQGFIQQTQEEVIQEKAQELFNFLRQKYFQCFQRVVPERTEREWFMICRNEGSYSYSPMHKTFNLDKLCKVAFGDQVIGGMRYCDFWAPDLNGETSPMLCSLGEERNRTWHQLDDNTVEIKFPHSETVCKTFAPCTENETLSVLTKLHSWKNINPIPAARFFKEEFPSPIYSLARVPYCKISYIAFRRNNGTSFRNYGDSNIFVRINGMWFSTQITHALKSECVPTIGSRRSNLPKILLRNSSYNFSLLDDEVVLDLVSAKLNLKSKNMRENTSYQIEWVRYDDTDRAFQAFLGMSRDWRGQARLDCAFGTVLPALFLPEETARIKQIVQAILGNPKVASLVQEYWDIDSLTLPLEWPRLLTQSSLVL